MGDDTVPLSDVLIVLKAKGVSISAVDSVIHRRYILAKDGWIEERTFTDPVGKHELYYLARRFSVYAYLFWHTELLETKPGEQIQ